MDVKKILDIFEEHGFNENNCSFFRQENIPDIAKDVIAAINYTRCCTELNVVDSDDDWIEEMIDKKTMSSEWRKENL